MELLKNQLNHFDVIDWHRAIVLHFKQDDYDCIKSHYKVNGKETYSNKRKHFFKSYEFLTSKFTNETDIKFFLLCCTLHDVTYISSINAKYNNLYEIYLNLIDFFNNQELYFKRDIGYILENYGSIQNSVKSKIGSAPTIIHLVFSKKIRPETVIILDYLCGILNVLDKLQSYNDNWMTLSRKLKKYKLFIDIEDVDHYKSIITHLTVAYNSDNINH